MTTIDNDKLCNRYICEKCQYKTNKKSSFDNHKLSARHNKKQESIIYAKKYACQLCEKDFNDRSGFWRHNKRCKTINNEQKETDSNVVIELIKQNQEFKEMIIGQNNQIIELCKNNNTNITNNVNSNNKTFNLQVFLNEDCKDAMNVTQFIDSFNLQLSDFENVGRLGFVNGISDIIIKKLKALDINERPIHCTDQKRQVLYAKVIDKWEKEGDDNKILRKIIKCVAFKNSKNIQLFRDKYPDCMNWDSKHADRYQILRIESLGGLGNEDVDNENKIIRKIAREITLDKNF